jgi:HD superfamily phosphohydrolase
MTGYNIQHNDILMEILSSKYIPGEDYGSYAYYDEIYNTYICFLNPDKTIIENFKEIISSILKSLSNDEGKINLTLITMSKILNDYFHFLIELFPKMTMLIKELFQKWRGPLEMHLEELKNKEPEKQKLLEKIIKELDELLAKIQDETLKDLLNVIKTEHKELYITSNNITTKFLKSINNINLSYLIDLMYEFLRYLNETYDERLKLIFKKYNDLKNIYDEYLQKVFEDKNKPLKDLEDEPLLKILSKLLGLDGSVCFELWRLGHLRQAGLACVVKYLDTLATSRDERKAKEVAKRASYNRLSHSLGCLYLGILALENIEVIDKGERKVEEREVKLLDYLKGNEERKLLLRNFLLALLLHDIGHYPFSHLLENSEKFKEIDVKHEDISVGLIKGDWCSSLCKEIVISSLTEKSEEEIDIRFVDEILEEFENKSAICRECICELINPKKYKRQCEHFKHDRSNRVLFNSIKDLVSGLIDLDRLDHYQRDDVFLELNILGKGVIELIKCIKINNKIGIYLDDRNVHRAIQLLQAKENIWYSGLDRDEIRLVEAIFVKMVDTLIENCGYTPWEIMFLTDEQLIKRLKYIKDKKCTKCNNDRCRIRIQRLYNFLEWLFKCEDGRLNFKNILEHIIRRTNILYTRQQLTLDDVKHLEERIIDENENEFKGYFLVYWFGKGYTSSPWIFLPIRILDGYKLLNELPRMKMMCESIRIAEEYGKATTRIYIIWDTTNGKPDIQKLNKIKDILNKEIPLSEIY